MINLKRLLKKANISLSHATTLEKFINICREGAIKPFNSTSAGQNLSNSVDQNSIYLTRQSGWEFARDCLDMDKYQTSVCLYVNVDETSLLPSYDIFVYDIDPEIDNTTGEKYVNIDGERVNLENLTWKDTIVLQDECRYNGEIPLSSIEEVVFFTRNSQIQSLIPTEERMSIEDAKKSVEEFLQT